MDHPAHLGRRPRVDVAVIFALAFAVRFGFIAFSRGGLGGDFNYDPSVYYTAADAFVHGRMPYADFFLLHPPGLMLALAPFAALGSAVGDHTAFMITDLAFCVLGAVNAVLVLLVARRLALPRIACLAGAGFYAIWFGSAAAEITPRLEPVGTFASLCGFLILARASTHTTALRRRDAVWVGVAFGAATCVKITWFAVLLTVLLWQLRNRESRRLVAPLALGAVGSGVVICGPFFVNAPSAMWRMVVRDQLGRAEITSFVRRVGEFTGLQEAYPGVSRATLHVAAGVFALILLAMGIAAWQVHAARLFVVIAGVQLAALTLSPSYFSYYSGYIGAAFAICVAAAIGAQETQVRSSYAEQPAQRARTVTMAGGVAAAVALLGATVVTLTATFVRSPKLVLPFPAARLQPAAKQVRCLMSDSPMALIELNALTRGLEAGCPNWVDVSGRTYDVDAPPDGKLLARTKNLPWQRDIKAYLLSGNGFILLRNGSVVSKATMQDLKRQPVLAKSGHFTLYAVP